MKAILNIEPGDPSRALKVKRLAQRPRWEYLHAEWHMKPFCSYVFSWKNVIGRICFPSEIYQPSILMIAGTHGDIANLRWIYYDRPNPRTVTEVERRHIPLLSQVPKYQNRGGQVHAMKRGTDNPYPLIRRSTDGRRFRYATELRTWKWLLTLLESSSHILWFLVLQTQVLGSRRPPEWSPSCNLRRWGTLHQRTTSLELVPNAPQSIISTEVRFGRDFDQVYPPAFRAYLALVRSKFGPPFQKCL